MPQTLAGYPGDPSDDSKASDDFEHFNLFFISPFRIRRLFFFIESDSQDFVIAGTEFGSTVGVAGTDI